MKINMLNSLSKLLGYNMAQRLGRRGRQNYARKMWNPNQYFTSGARRRRKGRALNKIEVNKAEGGYKQPYNNGRVVQQNVELYTSIYANTVNEYVFQGDIYSGNPKEYDVQAALNDNQEFLNLRRRALQYKVKYVALSFNYNRVPESKDKFSKMIITPVTDTVMESTNPKQNSNSMIWDMTSQGTKNYSFRINARNVEKGNQEWQEGISFWSALMRFKISSQGINDVTTNTDGVCLGELKVTFSVLYVRLDEENYEQGKLNTKTIVNLLAEENRARLQLKQTQEKIKQNEKLIEQIKQANSKMRGEESVRKYLNKSF